MSKARPDRPREVERHIIRSIRKLADADLLRLLEQLRDLTTKQATAQEART